MHIDLEPQQVALREELREYFAQLVTPEIRAGLASATGEPAPRDATQAGPRLYTLIRAVTVSPAAPRTLLPVSLRSAEFLASRMTVR